MQGVSIRALRRTAHGQSTALALGGLLGLVSLFLGLDAAHVHAQDLKVTAPTQATVGASLDIGFSGSANPRDFITVVKADATEGTYGAYQYARKSPVSLLAPALPGDYEIRYLAADAPYPTQWRQRLAVADTGAELTAPSEVDAGAVFEVRWSGPDNKQDFIAIVAAGAPEGSYEKGYQYTQKGSPLKLTAPDAAGNYEIRYLMGQSPYRTLGSRTLTVKGTAAAIEAPDQVAAGAPITFTWQGPDNAQDFITVVPATATDKEYDKYVYTKSGSPAELLAPETAGKFELRYLTGQSYAVLARKPIEVTAVTASVSGPAAAEALSVISVRWEGPGNPQDFVIIQPVGAPTNASGPYAYTHRGPELRITTPEEPGEYEYRYLTGQTQQQLAVQRLTVTPRKVPGELRVVSARTAATASATNSVIVVLDASGSMLQKLDGGRRIDIARAALTELVREGLPDGVQFGLRVFGHKEADSCRTDLEIALGPLNRQAAAAKVSAVQAMNLARTPIAETLSLAGEDLAGAMGYHLIILLTDGEETCDGDPAAVIRTLRRDGADVRVNIIGFAIDELMLAETFQQWAQLGGGQYIDARNAADLTAGLTAAIERPFEVQDAGGKVVASGQVNGVALELPPGDYKVTSGAGDLITVNVQAGEEAVLSIR
jgi:Mg-chelatase subunit ChlD